MEGLLIETTQNVTLEYQPASIGERILAYLLDGLVVLAWVFSVSLAFGLFSSAKTRDNEAFFLLFAVLILPVVLYDLALEILLNGQSIGKKALGIRVVMLDGRPPTLGAYLMRWLFRLVDLTLFSGVVAVITIAVNGKGQRLGDLAAKTTVVKLRPPVSLERVVAVPVVDPTYRVTYPEASLLSDRDATTLRQALNKGLSVGNETLVATAARKAREVTGIRGEGDDVQFLHVLLRDHAHLSLG
ncbi:MAG: RDD family protein [Sphingobacteriaceae bacterium]|nr:RDD family protein [Cytophagaceae bacterium]